MARVQAANVKNFLYPWIEGELEYMHHITANFEPKQGSTEFYAAVRMAKRLMEEDDMHEALKMMKRIVVRPQPSRSAALRACRRKRKRRRGEGRREGRGGTGEGGG